MKLSEILGSTVWTFYVIPALLVLLCFQSLRLRDARRSDRSSNSKTDAVPGKRFLSVLFSPWPFATLVLVCGIVIVIAAQVNGISFWTLITSNQLVGGIIVTIFGFLLFERLREYSERLKSTNERVDKFHEALKNASGDIKDELQADFQKKIDQGLAKFEDYVRDHSWVKKVIDELIADRFPNLRILTERAIDRIASNDFETGYELMRRASGQSQGKGESNKLYANPEDLEFSAFVAAFIIGDAELAVRLHARYAATFRLDPAFVCSYIRYLALSNDRDGASTWIDHVKDARALVSRFDRFPLLAAILPKRIKERLNIRRAMCRHWTAACVDVIDAILHEPDQKVEEATARLLSLDTTYRDQIVMSYMIAQIEILRGSPENAILYMEQSFQKRVPTALEFYLYVKLLRDCSPVLDTERLLLQLGKLLPRSPAERDVNRLAAAYLDSLRKKPTQTLTVVAR